MHNLRKKTVQITSSTINGKREVGQGNTTVKHGKYGPSSYTSYMKEIAVNTLKRKKMTKNYAGGEVLSKQKYGISRASISTLEHFLKLGK